MSPSAAAWRAELDARRAALDDIAHARGCQAWLVAGAEGHAEAFRYVTSFVPILGTMWAAGGGRRPPTCSLEFSWQLEEAATRSGIEDWHGAADVLAPVLAALRARKPERVAVAGAARMPAGHARALRDGLPGVELVEIDDEMATLRRAKSDLELALLREAARVTDEALAHLRERIEPGMTEREVAALAGWALRRRTGEWAFPPCVVSGVDAPVIPVREPTDRVLREGDTVMVDIGASCDGYQADASRTFVLGEPSVAQRRAWDVVVAAYDAALAACRPGVPAREIHAAHARVIEGAGYEIRHRVGHGIGLATSFEWPSLDTEPDPLPPGTTICIEPGVYAPGAGAMKLEDDLVMTADGYELLTKAERTL